MSFLKAMPMVILFVASGAVGKAADTPVNEIDAAQDPVRNAWVAENGKCFLKTKGTNRWVEYNETGKPVFRFVEMGATPERVELRDQVRGLSIHLYAQTSEWGMGEPPPQMVTLYKGRWTADPPAVTPEPVAERKAVRDKDTAAPFPSESELGELKGLEELVSLADARRVQAVCKGKSIPLLSIKSISAEAAAVLAETSKRSLVREEKACKYVVMVAVEEQIEKKVNTEELKENPDGTTSLVPVEKVELVTVRKCKPEERFRKYQIERELVPQLELDGLTEISHEIAVALARHDGDLSLNGVKMLDAVTASSLCELAGELQLNGLEQLSDDVAKALSQHEGGLSLRGLKTVSKSCFDLLQSKQCFAEDIVIDE